MIYNCSVENAPLAEIARMGPIGLLEAGIPCQPFSTARRLEAGGQKKRDMSLAPEAHALGDMVFWTLHAAAVLNPAAIVAEETPGFLAPGCGAGWIFRTALERMGYRVEAKVVDPAKDGYGELQSRKRAVIVATTGQAFQWPKPEPNLQRTMAEILLDPDDPRCEWFDESTKPWFFRHAQRHRERGNGFGNVLEIRTTDLFCPTITKRYFALRGGSPVAVHPRQEGVYRFLTIPEVVALTGLPEDYVLPESKTIAGEIMGQGVLVGFFRRIFETVRRQEVAAESEVA
jgi:DNA (cytosine-5)-methyltransferase 1